MRWLLKHVGRIPWHLLRASILGTTDWAHWLASSVMMLAHALGLHLLLGNLLRMRLERVQVSDKRRMASWVLWLDHPPTGHNLPSVFWTANRAHWLAATIAALTHALSNLLLLVKAMHVSNVGRMLRLKLGLFHSSRTLSCLLNLQCTLMLGSCLLGDNQMALSVGNISVLVRWHAVSWRRAVTD